MLHARLNGRQVRALLCTAAIAFSATVLLPSGFFFSAFGHPEGDPSPVVVLVPLGALALLYGLGRTAHAAWR